MTSDQLHSFIQSMGGISYNHKKTKVGITEVIGIKMTDETDTKKRKMEDEPEAELGMYQ